MENHEKYIKRCIELAKEAFMKGNDPFGSVIVCNGEVIVESEDKTGSGDVTDHAEIIAMKEAQRILNTKDLSHCIIYSNCEPCPMCSFMIRELRFQTVVFGAKSPHMGGYSKWNILEDEGLALFPCTFSSPPNIISGVLEEEAKEIFNTAGWKMINEVID